jgi:hypothetical protein
MRIKLVNNAELVIQANVNKEGDYGQAMARAERMVEASGGMMEIASNDEYEQWIHLCAGWDDKQASDLKDLYNEAK